MMKKRQIRKRKVRAKRQVWRYTESFDSTMTPKQRSLSYKIGRTLRLMAFLERCGRSGV